MRKIIGVALISLVVNWPVNSDTSDHIGPDPIQSDNCVTITPGRSVSCVGRQLASIQQTVPTVTINCGPGIFMLITHRPLPADSSVRNVRLFTEDGEHLNQWLAISDTQSGLFVYYGGMKSDDYEWMVRLIGKLLTPDSSVLGYSIAQREIEGVFELNYSDRKLVEQIGPNC